MHLIRGKHLTHPMTGAAVPVWMQAIARVGVMAKVQGCET